MVDMMERQSFGYSEDLHADEGDCDCDCDGDGDGDGDTSGDGD